MDDIKNLLALAIKAESTSSMKDRQIAKMQGGKINKRLLSANAEAITQKIGVKTTN